MIIMVFLTKLVKSWDLLMKKLLELLFYGHGVNNIQSKLMIDDFLTKIIGYLPRTR